MLQLPLDVAIPVRVWLGGASHSFWETLSSSTASHSGHPTAYLQLPLNVAELGFNWLSGLVQTSLQNVVKCFFNRLFFSSQLPLDVADLGCGLAEQYHMK